MPSPLNRFSTPEPASELSEMTQQSEQLPGNLLDPTYWAADCANTLPQLVDKCEAKRVFILASSSLATATNRFAAIRSGLGGRLAGLFHQIGEHTPREDVLAAAEAARHAKADLLVSIGGGSIIDATKMVQLVLDQNIYSENELLQYAQSANGKRGPKYGDFSLFGDASSIRQIAVPTTLSGAEYSNTAGVKDTRNSAKEAYRGIDLRPLTIVYDPELTLHTPHGLWLSTAIRSLDHAVEGYCSEEADPDLENTFLRAMSLFAESLPRVHQHPDELAARSQNQQAVALACSGLGKVSHGASHGIGYILGSFLGVPHGHTSCVMLAAVLEWNASYNCDRQATISSALGRVDVSAGKAVRDLIESLGLPANLPQVGVLRKHMTKVAKLAVQHPVVQKNPRPILDYKDVLEILELAWDRESR